MNRETLALMSIYSYTDARANDWSLVTCMTERAYPFKKMSYAQLTKLDILEELEEEKVKE